MRLIKKRHSNSTRLSAACGQVIEALEGRVMMTATIAGSSTVYPTIQAAVNAAPAGATINVAAGTYDETVSIYQPVTILGAQAGVDARNSRGTESIVYATQTVFYVDANDVTINGFTIEGDDADIGAAQGAGVLMAPSIHGTQVLNNIIQSNVTGIYLSNNSNTDQCLIQHNLIQNNFEANNNWQTKQENGSRGIYTDGTVSGGYLTNVLINANTIANFNFNAGDEDEGIIALQALTAGKQFNITITNNALSEASKALLATNVTNLVFIGNTATKFDDASSGPVRFEGDANVVDIQYNTIEGNSGPGVAADSSGVSGDSSGFVVNNNNIYSNDGIGVLTIANVYDGALTAVGDYWGNASGPSGDGPGTGQAVWANGVSGHGVTPKGSSGGIATFSPWATSLINITAIPVPAAPTVLIAAPLSASQIQLNWTAPMSTAFDQLIQRSTDGVNFATVATVPPLLNSFTDTGLTGGSTYTYRVIAANPTGNSSPSNTAVASTIVYHPPVAPSGLTMTSESASTITLQWSLPSYTVGIANYSVYRGTMLVGTTTTPTFTDIGLAAGTAYAYTVVTNDTSGASSSPSSPLTVTTLTVATPAFPTGFAGMGSQLALNGIPFINGSNLELTNGTANEANSAYFATPVALSQFNTQFTFQLNAATGDGFTFCIQGTGPAAVGGSGGSLGYAGIAKSLAVKFDIYSNAGEGTDSTGLYINGAIPENVGSIDLTPSGMVLSSGDVFQVNMAYNGTTLAVTITDTTTGKSATQNYTVNIPSIVGNTGYVGFTGATGGSTAVQNILTWNWSTAAAPLPNAPTSLAAVAASQTAVNLNWTDNATGIENGFIVQRSTDGVNYTQIASVATGITHYMDTTGVAGTTYSYRIAATSSAGNSSFGAPASVSTLSASLTPVAVSSLTWVSATAGYGTVQKNQTISGNTITLGGQTYASGIGTHASSSIVYALGGQYSVFTSDVGVDDEENGKGTGSVDFQVIGDGKILFDSGVLHNGGAAVHIDISVVGVQSLTLMANPGVTGSIDYDHSDWAGATLFALPMVAPAPSNLTAAASSPTSINLTWSDAATGITAFILQRSTDGVTFTTLASNIGPTTKFYTDSTVAPSTKYYYQVLAINTVGNSLASAIVSTTTPSSSAITTNLSSLNWVSATAGWGTVQKNLSIGGNTITLRGTPYASGIGTHAVSNIVYNLAGGYTNFLSDIGIDDEEVGKGTGSVDFQVIGDGKTLYDSGVLTNASPVVSININVTGVQTLTLIANNGVVGSIDYDHADWAGARLLSTSAIAPAAPSNLVAVTASSTQVNLTWTNNAATATGFIVQRSTDGVNFTQIATTGAAATNYFDKTALAGTAYTYRILATNGVTNSVPSSTATAMTFTTSAVITNLSSLAWTSATAGWGAVQTDSSIAGNTITLGSVTYSSGIGTHAASTIIYNLGGNYTHFVSDVGIDAEENGRGIGSVDFQVIGDGKVLFDSGILTNASPIVSLNVNVAGVQTLTLVVTNGIPGSIDYDHADWAGAKLVSGN